MYSGESFVLEREVNYMQSSGIVDDGNIIIYADKVNEYLLSDNASIKEIEDFLGQLIPNGILEELEFYVDQELAQMPDEIIKEFYDKFNS